VAIDTVHSHCHPVVSLSPCLHVFHLNQQGGCKKKPQQGLGLTSPKKFLDSQCKICISSCWTTGLCLAGPRHCQVATHHPTPCFSSNTYSYILHLQWSCICNP
jgi:hypothetical protein